MALGGGTFITQNKVLPGSYYNVVSATRASATLSDRGVAAMPLELDWGKEKEIFSVTEEELQKNSMEMFGCPYTDPKLTGIKEVLLNAKLLYVYRLNSNGEKAKNTIATARFGGTRGNDLKIAISENPDSEPENKLYDVETLMDTKVVDTQTVSTVTELKDNAYVVFKKEGDLVSTVATPLTGGTNGAEVKGEKHQEFLNKIESYNFNALGVPVSDSTTKKMYVAFTKRMRDEVGAKFQTVLFRENADYEGVVSVENEVEVGEDGSALMYVDDEKVSIPFCKNTALVYWVTGIIAGCNINKSNTNKKYDGELLVKTAYTQMELEEGIKSGKFLLHNVDGEVHVLTDINTFVSFTKEKTDDFSSNQVIRVLDQDAIETGKLFNLYYLGKVQNITDGRSLFKSDLVALAEEMQRMQAIENFTSDDITVEQGQGKKDVVVSKALQPAVCMEKLYTTVTVR